MTEAAEKIVSPIPMESLSKNKCLIDTFDRNFTMETEHIAVADAADVLLIAPATANTIAKLACGIADNMLTTTALACKCTKMIAPAMNTAMYENPVTQDNLMKLKKYGWEIIDPVGGRLACGAVGLGKMVEPQTLFEYIERALSIKRDLSGKNVIVTAGPTREALDPVRYITNHSSGKMGYAIAKRAALRGANVTLVSGPVSIEPPLGVEVVDIISAEDMYNAVVSRFDRADIVIKAAAVADYRPAVRAEDKIKKSDGDMKIELERTKDIIATLGSMKRENQFLCGFSMETRDMVENSKKKLVKKNLDMIAANNVKVKGAGFAGDTNILTVITKDGVRELPLLSKEEAADVLLDMIAEKMGL
jgi:phosphopantothenoylcysteine decarboxylase/phosphopantothenate--cysteine ligase